jgi:hypothetical protein
MSARSGRHRGQRQALLGVLLPGGRGFHSKRRTRLAPRVPRKNPRCPVRGEDRTGASTGRGARAFRLISALTAQGVITPEPPLPTVTMPPGRPH